uniref:Uncharacterized protein n=1 Tax=Eptatretus burgeri TaxID=7764 RepID=A0A8C4Q2A9_EPTBU
MHAKFGAARFHGFGSFSCAIMNQFDQLLDNESDLLDIFKVVKAKKESNVTKVCQPLPFSALPKPG